MMNQDSGKFEPVPRAAEKVLVVDDVDLDINAPREQFVQPSAPAPKSSRAWPTLAEGEVVVVGIEHGNFPVLGDLGVVVEKIKRNGKLFVYAPLGAEKVSVGNIFSIKGIKFSVRRVNALGQIGLSMMTTAQIAALELLPKPMTLAEQDAALKAKGVPSFHPASFEEPKDTPHPLFPPSGPSKSQVARAERRERRLEEVAIRRARNRQDAEYAREKGASISESREKPLTKAERREQGAAKAAERQRRRKLEPMLKAQAAARARAEAERASRKSSKSPADLVVGVL